MYAFVNLNMDWSKWQESEICHNDNFHFLVILINPCSNWQRRILVHWSLHRIMCVSLSRNTCILYTWQPYPLWHVLSGRSWCLVPQLVGLISCQDMLRVISRVLTLSNSKSMLAVGFPVKYVHVLLIWWCINHIFKMFYSFCWYVVGNKLTMTFVLEIEIFMWNMNENIGQLRIKIENHE